MEVIGELTRAIRITAGDESEIGSARRQAFALAGMLDFDEVHCGQVGIVVTEAAHNLSMHGGGGEILLTPWRLGLSSGLDVLAIDKGSGIDDVNAAMQDGFSTTGTAGTGLGALARLAHVFEVFTKPGGGTAVLARMLRTADTPAPTVRLGAVDVPYGTETVSGDGWAALLQPHRSVYFMADGLGHGHMASELLRTRR